MLGATPDFSHVVFGSTDHTLMSKKPTGTDEESYDVYDWFNGELHIIDVKENGELLGKCGATVGGGQFGNGGFPELSHEAIHNAVSEDGSKIFITTPDPQGLGNDHNAPTVATGCTTIRRSCGCTSPKRWADAK